MPSNPSHFAINADDLDATRRFYEAVLGWTFTEWGPPGFLQIRPGEDPGGEVIGALQERRELVPGTRTVGYECTFAVEDVQAVLRAATAAGGKVLMEPFTIPGVGELVWVEDPAGNPFGAMRYERDGD